MMAKIMNLPIHKVRFIMSPVGGGFGGKEDMIYQGMLALLATKTRHPIKYVMTGKKTLFQQPKDTQVALNIKWV